MPAPKHPILLLSLIALLTFPVSQGAMAAGCSMESIRMPENVWRASKRGVRTDYKCISKKCSEPAEIVAWLRTAKAGSWEEGKRTKKAEWKKMGDRLAALRGFSVVSTKVIRAKRYRGAEFHVHKRISFSPLKHAIIRVVATKKNCMISISSKATNVAVARKNLARIFARVRF